MSDADSTDDAGGDRESLVQRITPNFVRRSFAVKFGIVLLVMGLSVGVIGVAATEQVKSETQDNVRDEYKQVALQEADLIDQWVTRNRLSTKLVSSNSDLANDENLREQLENENAELSGDVRAMHIVRVTPAGSAVVESTSLESGTDAATVNRGWVEQESFNETSGVATSSVYRAGGEPLVGFLSPIAGSDNRLLLVEYELETIADSLQGVERADGGFTQVVNSSGTVMIDEPRHDGQRLGDEMLQSYSNGEADQPIEDANSLRQSTQEAGVAEEMEPNSNVIDDTYTVGYAPIGETDWVVLVHAPHSEVFAFVNQIQTWGLIATIVEVLLIGGVGAALGYSTSSAINRLTSKTEEMREGELDVEIRSTRIDEIGRLYDGFADMRDSLKTQIDEAEKARKEAEVSRAEAQEMANYLEEKAEEFSRAMEQTAAGDMTQRMSTEGENESMDRIAQQFNSMIEELEKTTGQLKSFSDEVAESGDVVLTSAESVRQASEQVAESVQKMSDDAYEQKERLHRLSEDLDDLVATLESVQDEHPDVDVEDSIDEFRDLARTIQAAADTSEEMMAESENVAGAAEEQAAELNEVSSRAEKLKRYARPLGDILDRFETEAEHEFVFSGGPSQSTLDDADD